MIFLSLKPENYAVYVVLKLSKAYFYHGENELKILVLWIMNVHLNLPLFFGQDKQTVDTIIFAKHFKSR